MGSILGEKIGIIRDRYRRKKITFYMMHQTQDHTVYPHDEATLWIDIEDALEKMKHASERKFLKRHFL